MHALLCIAMLVILVMKWEPSCEQMGFLVEVRCVINKSFSVVFDEAHSASSTNFFFQFIMLV